MTRLKSSFVAAALVLAATSSFAQSVRDGSQASALSAAGLSAAVAFVPLSVTIGGSALSVLTIEHLSRMLSEEVEWVVERVHENGPRTELQLKAKKAQPTVMIVGVPTKQVVTHQVTVNNHIHFERLGPQAFAMKRGGQTLGVMAQVDSTTNHSVKK